MLQSPGSARRSARGSRWVALAALAAGIALAGAGRAQTPEPAVPPAAAPEAPRIAVSEIPARTEEELGRIEAEHRERSNLVEIDEIERQLPETLESVRSRSASLDERLRSVSSFDALLAIERRFLELQQRIESWKQSVAQRTRQSEIDLESLRERAELWARAFADARREPAPEVVINSARRVQREIDEATREVRELRNRLLNLQGELSKGGDLEAIALAKIAERQQAMLSSLLLRNEPPLWAMRANPPGARPFGVRLSEHLAEQKSGFARLLGEQTERVVLQLLLWLGAAFALSALRERARIWRADVQAAATGKVSLVFEHPYAIATLVALGVTRWLYVDPPPAAHEAAQLLLLFPALVLISPLVETALRPALLVLAGFYVVDQLRGLSEGLPVIERTLFLAEMVLGCAASVWLLRRVRANGRMTLFAAGSREVAPLLVRGVGIAFGVAFVCGSLGFMRLAQLAGDGLLGSGYIAILVYAGVQIAQGLVAFVLRSGVLKPLRSLSSNNPRLESGVHTALAVLGAALWAAIALELFGLRRPLLEVWNAALAIELGFGTVTFSIREMIHFAVTVIGALLTARLLETILEYDVYPRFHVQRGTGYAVSTLLRYTVILIGLMLAATALGFDPDRVTVLLGAFGVGIGFGLQNVVNNFVCGLILLFERPVQLGDTIDVGGAQGKVHRIGIRATVVRTYDGSEVTIPNGQLLSERLTNWTKADRHRRIEIPIGVAYGSDPDAVIELLVDAASEHPNIISTPAPSALFRGFGETSLDFVLYAWVSELDDWQTTRSDIIRTVHRRLREQGVDVPLLRRDVRLRAVPGAAAPQPGAESAAAPRAGTPSPGRDSP